MADNTVVHIGENSPEKVAYLLMIDCMNADKIPRTKKSLLDTYAECFTAVRGNRKYARE